MICLILIDYVFNCSDSQAVLVQNKVDTSPAFNRSWQDYKIGFSDSTGNYWLGNDAIHSATLGRSCQLFIIMTKNDFTVRYVQYTVQSVGDETSCYFWSLWYSGGNATNCGLGDNANHKFSTFDRDNDNDPNLNCASLLGAGWWYGWASNVGMCGMSNLNSYSTSFLYKSDSWTAIMVSCQMWLVC